MPTACRFGEGMVVAVTGVFRMGGLSPFWVVWSGFSLVCWGGGEAGVMVIMREGSRKGDVSRSQGLLGD